MKTILKICIFILLNCLLFQNSYSQQNINGWYWMNGQPQSNTLNWVNIINPAVILAVGANGTFMRSNDGGDTWLINSQAGATDNPTSGGGTLNLNTAYFFDANTGLVGGPSLSVNGDAIGRTTDGGLTFSRISLGSGSYSVTGFSFINSTTGFACGNTTTKLVKTTDAGLSWVSVPNLPVYSYYSVYAFNENKIIVTTSARRIIMTTDGGNNWDENTLPGTVNNDITAIEFKNANTGYVTGNSSYFGFTTDGGINWTQAIPPGGSIGQRALSISGNDVYTAGDFTNIYKTSDNGVSWTSINFVDGSNLYQPSPYIMYGLSINGNNIAVVGNGGIINMSNDLGSSWRNKNYCVSNSAYTFSSIFSDKASGNIWAGGTPGTILFSSNGGANWIQQASNSTYPTSSFQMLNSTTGFVTTGSASPNGGNLLKTTNAGTNWINIPLPSPYSSYNAVDLDFINENTGWIIGGLPFSSGITCIKTTNGGSTWVQQPNDQNYNSVSVDIDMVDANTGYFIAGTTISVFKTTNGGTNWNRLPSSPGTGSYNKLQTVSADVVYLSGSNGQLFKSTNSGSTWNSIAVPRPVTLFAMNWLDENNGLLGGTSGFLAKTTNGGLNWSWTNSGGSTIREVCFKNRDSVYAVSDLNGNWQIFRNYSQSPSPLSLVLKVGIEGFWNGTTQVSDTVKVSLRNPVSPYNLVGQGKTVIYNHGSGTVSFNTTTAGNYYIQINHRNSLETWSSLPVTINSNINEYEFISSSSKAYGNNTILKSGRYCDYSGDVNQSGEVNLTDLVETINASSVFTAGYVAADVTGDNLVDLSDVTIVFNNASAFVTKITP